MEVELICPSHNDLYSPISLVVNQMAHFDFALTTVTLMRLRVRTLTCRDVHRSYICLNDGDCNRFFARKGRRSSSDLTLGAKAECVKTWQHLLCLRLGDFGRLRIKKGLAVLT
jgi:hypothetical protein